VGDNQFRRAGQYIKESVSNPYLWTGVAGLLGAGLLIYIVINFILMPGYTRHGDFVVVPDVRNYVRVDAERSLEQRGLRVEVVPQRYSANTPRDAVVDQSPSAGSQVKPGRRVYVTVNTGDQAMIRVPRLEDLSLREATGRLSALGLRAGDVRPDTIPSPYANTITRQDPVAGDSLPQGGSVRLWYSTGLGSDFVSMPDVTGMTLGEAEAALLEHRLRFVVIGGDPDDRDAYVERQSREPGTRVREGFEIRLFVAGDRDYDASPTSAPDLEI
jgi:eukaryotic-like serine/threonine-protein kinase